MKNQEKINNVSTVAVAAALFAVPAMLIFEQPNLSTCLVTLVIVLGIVFSAGISYRWIVGVLSVTIPMVGACVYLLLHGLIPFIKEYQAGRILAWFYPDKYGEARYQQNNSIIAIGSGQLKGKGLFNTTIASVKNGNFLSEEQTDFIFAVIGEGVGLYWLCYSHHPVPSDRLRMPDDGSPCKRSGRTADLYRYGYIDRISGICQYCSCNRYFSQYRASSAVYQLRKQFPYQYFYWYGISAECRTSESTTTLLIQGGL